MRTRYWEEGEGTPLVLIHGFADSVETWSRVIGRLAEHHRVIALDVVGAGRTDKPKEPMPFARLAGFVRDFMDVLGLERAHVLGHSMGGGIALNLTIRWPEKVERLVLVDSAGLGREMPVDLRVCTLPVLGWFLTRTSPRQTASFLRKTVYDPTLITDGTVRTFCELGALPGAHTAMLSWLRNNADFGGWRDDVVRPVVEKLGSITAPTLIFWGRQDRIIPVSQSEVAERGIPGSRLHIFESCGHVPQLERWEEFSSLVVDFLGKQE